jgi:hypothetical protein
MRIQSTRDFSERGLDAYFTCPEAIESLILLEGDRLPQRIWEPAAGDGAIVKPLRARGRIVHASASCTRPTSRITVCRAAASWIPVRPDPADRLGRRPRHQSALWPSPGIRREGARRGALRGAAGPHELSDGRRAARALARSETADARLLPLAAPADDAQARLGGYPGRRATPRTAGSSGRPESRLRCPSAPTGGNCSQPQSR